MIKNAGDLMSFPNVCPGLCWVVDIGIKLGHCTKYNPLISEECLLKDWWFCPQNLTSCNFNIDDYNLFNN